MKKNAVTDLKADISAYLDEAKMMQLATAAANKPWICNVWFVADENFTVYWISSTKRRHSEELENNSSVAASFCIPRQPSESNRGALQLEGTATRVVGFAEEAMALKLYVKRGFFSLEQVQKFMASPDNPHVFYRITPERIVYFSNGAREYSLPS